MTITLRACAGRSDFAAISDFLYTLYQPDNRDGNWFQPMWEYAYTHPWFDDASVQRIGVWEDNGAIVAVATYEMRLGEAFFQAAPAYAHLKPEMLDYTEQQLAEPTNDGKHCLKAYVNDFDTAFAAVVQARGYTPEPRSHRPMAQFVIPDPFPPIRLRDGFRLKSLADDNNLTKVDRVLHRGFNHPGEPEPGGEEDRKRMQSGPHFRKDLTIVVEAPNGDFVSFSGLWYDPVNRFGYVEPVATDPDYRRMGLGTAAVLEGIRRCAELGATVAYVGNDLPIYLAMGFKTLYTLHCWQRIWNTD
jgi:GNAT superfamily N-acetyltransferase